MTDSRKSTKEQARHWLEQRAKVRKPLPDQKELRRQLGMDLIDANRKNRKR